jgi:putative alpha-1,2-mannosidase
MFHTLNRPGITQYKSRRVIDKVFSGVDPGTGYNGDEDQGLMGSLAVLTKLGLFQMNGGTKSNPKYQISPPIFNKINIDLHPKYYSGENLMIKSNISMTNEGILKKVYFNGEHLEKMTLPHSSITTRGTLEYLFDNP